jgi:hypothetical protein
VPNKESRGRRMTAVLALLAVAVALIWYLTRTQ